MPPPQGLKKKKGFWALGPLITSVYMGPKGALFYIKISATVLATMWSMWVRSLIRLSFCLRNFYGYLRGLRQ